MKMNRRFLAVLRGVMLAASVLFPFGRTQAQVEGNEVKAPSAAIEAEDTNVVKQIESEPESITWRSTKKPIVVFGNDVVLKENESCRDIVVLFGSAKIDGEVEENLVVLFGSATVNGKVGRNFVNILGKTTLGPKADIKENAVVVGGPWKIDPETKIGGERWTISLERHLPRIAWLTDWLGKGLLLGRPFPPQVGWVWIVALGLLIVYCLMAIVFPRPVDACVRALEIRPFGSFFLGLLMFLLFGPAMLLLLASGVGILVIPFLLCAMIAAFLFGKVAVFRYAGEQIVGQFGMSGLRLPLVALIMGTAVFYLLYMVPFLGFIAWGVAAPLGVGAVFMALFGVSRPEGVRVNPSVFSGSSAIANPSQPIPPVYPSAPGDLGASQPLVLRRGGFWIRTIATFLDFLIIGGISAFVRHFSFFIIAWIAYHVAMWTFKGTTIGGTVMRIKIVRTDGRPIDFAVAIVRCLSSFFSAVVLFLGFFWAGWSREKQSWHDKIAGTVVVKMPKGALLI